LQQEKTKETSVFQSKAERFVTPRPLRLEDLDEERFKKLSYATGLLDKHKMNLMIPENAKSNDSTLATKYVNTISKRIPFNSQSPRFGNPLGLSKYQSVTPGPGTYDKGKINTEYDVYLALYEADGIKIDNSSSKLSAAFKSEERLKNSLIDS